MVHCYEWNQRRLCLVLGACICCVPTSLIDPLITIARCSLYRFFLFALRQFCIFLLRLSIKMSFLSNWTINSFFFAWKQYAHVIIHSHLIIGQQIDYPLEYRQLVSVAEWLFCYKMIDIKWINKNFLRSRLSWRKRIQNI